jgi:general bacterial porin, GBP family
MLRKSLTIAAVAASYTCGTHAQSSVSLSGLIDASLVYTSNVNGHSNWQAGSGAVTGSHWGLMGKEVLGQGTSAIFRLENGFSVMNGSLRQGGREFGYQAYTGLNNDRLGALTIGRQYDSVVDYVAPLSFTGVHPGGNNLAVHPFDNDNLNNSFRVNNSVKYASPTYAGLRFGTLYGSSNEAGGFSDNRAYSFGTSYANGPLSVGAAYLRANNVGNANANGAITSTDQTFVAAGQQVYGAGANYSFNRVRIGFVWTHTKIDSLTTINGANGLGLSQNGSGATFTNYEFSGSYRLTPALNINGEYTFTDGLRSTQSAAHHPKWHEVSLQVDYFFSRRTDAYLQGSYQRIIADGSGLTADISGQGISSSSQQTVLAAGIRHRF